MATMSRRKEGPLSQSPKALEEPCRESINQQKKTFIIKMQEYIQLIHLSFKIIFLSPIEKILNDMFIVLSIVLKEVRSHYPSVHFLFPVLEGVIILHSNFV